MKMLMISPLEYIFTSSLNKMHLSSNQFHKLFLFLPILARAPSGQIKKLLPLSKKQLKCAALCFTSQGWGGKILAWQKLSHLCLTCIGKNGVKPFSPWFTRENSGSRSQLVKITVEPTELVLDLQTLKTSPVTFSFLVSSSLWQEEE